MVGSFFMIVSKLWASFPAEEVIRLFTVESEKGVLAQGVFFVEKQIHLRSSRESSVRLSESAILLVPSRPVPRGPRSRGRVKAEIRLQFFPQPINKPISLN
jgi:hypothetical protein